MRQDLRVGVCSQGFGNVQPYNFRWAPVHDRRQATVGVGVVPTAVHMCDMCGHHLRGKPCARFYFGQFALRLFECRDCRRQFAVCGRNLFGSGKHLFRQKFRPGAQQLLLRFDLSDVSIDRDPTTLWQRCAFDADRTAIRPFALHVVRLERAGLIDPCLHKALHVRNRSIFTPCDEERNGFCKVSTRLG